MSIFDKLRAQPEAPAAAPAASAEAPTQTFTFNSLPESLAELQATPEAVLDSPYKTAALSLCALCAYAADKNIGIEMLNFLRGPRPLSPYDILFLDDRFRDGNTYVPFSYFKGATPDNNYLPSLPFTVTIESNPYSDANEGYKKLFIKSGGADNPREIVLRMRGDGKWFLWDQFLLVGIRTPKAQDPWA